MLITKIKEKLKKKALNYYSKSRKVITGFYYYHLLSKFTHLKPRKMLISLTYWCNSRCIMCNIWKIKPKNELSLDEWRKTLNDPVFENIEELDITGGEPILYKDFDKVTSLFIKKMPKLKKMKVISNGFETKLIIKKLLKLAKKCKKENIKLIVTISIDGIEEMHEVIRRIPNGFKKSTTTLFALEKIQKKYDISFASSTVVMKRNIDHLEEIESWFQKKKISLHFQIVGFHDTYVNNLDTKDKVNFDKNTKNKLFKFLKKMSIPSKFWDLRSYYWNDLLFMYKYKKPRTTPCPFTKDQFAIDSLGQVYNCFSTQPIGNFRRTYNISDIYFSKKNIDRKNNLVKTSCSGCNSGCNISDALSADLIHFLWYKITKKPWYGVKNFLRF